MDPESSKVCTTKKQLDNTARLRDQAETRKSAEREALRRAMEALEKAWNRHAKEHRKEEAAAAERRLNAAKALLEEYDRKSLEQAEQYLAAEEEYKSENGQVRYPTD